MRILISAFLVTSLCLPGLYAQDQDADVITPDAVKQLIQDGELDKAIDAIEQGDLAPSEARSLRREVANGFVRQRAQAKAFKLYEKNVNEGLESAADASDLMSLQVDLIMLANYGPLTGNTDQTIEALDEAMTKMQTISLSDVQRNSFEFPLALSKAKALARSNNADAAAKIVDEYITRARQLKNDNPNDEEYGRLLYSAIETGVQGNIGENVGTLAGELLQLANADLEADMTNPTNVVRYMSATGLAVSRIMDSDPKAVEPIIENARNKLAAIKEANESNTNRQIEQILSNFERNLDSTEARIESAIILANLVGNPAPAIDAQYWVNGEATDLESLKGKVVLVDFWAVWCGPCIATFPHLRSLREEYADQGLEIIGVTRKYNYEWNEKAGRASRVADTETHTDEAEIAMLEKFLAHHELKHPTVVIPMGSEMFKQYGVSGIPHVVLIDKQGIVRMYKVGSGEANAKAIHEMITQLLAE